MKKLLYTFFFGFATFKYRRLIRTPIILIILIIFGIAIIEFTDSAILRAQAYIIIIFLILLAVSFLSYVIEPFVIEKKRKEVISLETPLDEPIVTLNVSQQKSTPIISSQIETNDKPPIHGNFKKIYRIIIVLIKKFNNNKILSNIFYYSLFFIGSVLILAGLGNFFSSNSFKEFTGFLSFMIGIIIIIIIWKYGKVF
jgi:hypothetical protein